MSAGTAPGPESRPGPGEPEPGDGLVELEVGDIAHGGHFVARHEGRVVFVRHALPGERVRARLTDCAETARFWRADAVEVIVASPHRVDPPCPWSGPGRCGGCDFQHVTPAAQRDLKARVVAEQLRRLGGFDLEEEPWAPVKVESVDGDDAGLGWRTRVRFAVDRAGRAGLRRWHSHEVIAVDHCRIAHPRVDEVDVTGRPWRGIQAVDVVATPHGSDRLVVVEPADGVQVRARRDLPPQAAESSLAVADADGLRRLSGRTWVSEEVALPVAGGTEPRRFRVGGAGFWQVHPGAPAALAEAVVTMAAPRAGERAWDLYSGVGLFSAALGLAVGVTGRVVAVESEERAVRDARRNLHDMPWVEVVGARVERWVAGEQSAPDIVVLDPPRSGAGSAVIRAVAAAGPRVIVLVGCDPAAFARDLRTAGETGYRTAAVRAFDLFPMTHHLECVARLVRAT